MDDKHPVYDTTVLGMLTITSFWLISLVVNDGFAMWIYGRLLELLVAHEKAASEAIARWMAVGVFSILLGNIVQVIAITVFQWWPPGGTGRKALADKTKDWVKRSCISTDLKKEIDASPDDSLFVWVHYSDPRERLITWGRWKLRYAYLAENWITAIVTGLVMGPIFKGFLWVTEFWVDKNKVFPWANCNGIPWQVQTLIFCLLAVVCLIAIGGLIHMRKINRDADLKMLAVYAAGILCPDFRRKFLPPRKDDGKPGEA